MFARSLLLYDFYFNHRNFHWEPASDLLFLKVFFNVTWVWESLFASGEMYRVCMSPAKIKKRRVMLQLHGSSALNFFLLGNWEEAIKTVCNIFINVEVVVVICIVVYTTCKKNSPNDHLDSGYYPLTQVLRSGVLFCNGARKSITG